VLGDRPRQFTLEQLELTHALASLTAAAIERARLQEVEADRHRLDGALLAVRTIAHELNNALMPVVGYAELLGEEPGLTPEGRRRLADILAGAERAVETVRRLQRLTRLRAASPATLRGPELLDLSRDTGRDS
jgi:signal transduction histidine kinase